MFQPNNSGRKSNRAYRSREHLTETEIEHLLEVASKHGPNRQRNYLLVLLMFRHGLRISEAANLRWDAVLFDDEVICIYRAKKGLTTHHPIAKDELTLLATARQTDTVAHYVFSSPDGQPLTTGAIAKLLRRLGVAANLPLPLHAHMLRHSCGFALANQNVPTETIQAYLGHKHIAATGIYIAANPARFTLIRWKPLNG